MRYLFRLAIVLTLLLPIVGRAQEVDIVGNYTASGQNPGGDGRYSGQVIVRKTGDTYQIAWVIGNQRYIGTGIYQNNRLAIVFQPEHARPGVALFDVMPNGTISGHWTILTGQTAGIETWTPRGRI